MLESNKERNLFQYLVKILHVLHKIQLFGVTIIVIQVTQNIIMKIPVLFFIHFCWADIISKLMQITNNLNFKNTKVHNFKILLICKRQALHFIPPCKSSNQLDLKTIFQVFRVWSRSYKTLFFFFFFFFFGVKLGHFKINYFFPYVTNTKAYQ